MQNFTEEIKNEIIEIGFETSAERVAAFSAFLRTSGSVLSEGGVFGFELVTENSRTADLFEDILTNDFGISPNTGAKFDLINGKDKFVFKCVGEKAERLLSSIGVVGEDAEGKFVKFGIADELLNTEESRAAYVKGAFLGGGSCTLPDSRVYSSTGYHLEFVFSNVISARDFCDLLCAFDILVKLVTRKDSTVVYVKSKEALSDILYILSAEDCRATLNKIVEQKDIINNANRTNNCSVSNIDKTVKASVNQVRAIETIRQTVGLKVLDASLFEVAEARLADKSASMQELADRLHLSKSCLNHRMRKIISMAKELEN